MDAARIAAKVRYGYGKAAVKLGTTALLFRPSGSGDPVAPGSQYATGLAAVDNDPLFGFSRSNRFGNPVVYALMDATGVLIGDYMQLDGITYFITATDGFTACSMVQCNRIVTVLRHATGTAGAGHYEGERTPLTALATNWPASMLLGARQIKGDAGLPLDTTMKGASVLLPSTVPGILRTSDLLTDDAGRRFTVSGSELSPLGWRLTAEITVA